MRKKIYVIGDSHSFEFEGIPNCIICYIGPRTMHRIGRDGLSILDFRTFNIQESDVVVLVFGEIDVRCHIGKQRDEAKRDIDEIIDALIKNYFRSIMTNISFYKNLSVFVYTVTPPRDYGDSLEFPIYGTITDRICILKRLNEKLKKTAQEFNIEVIDVFDDFADLEGKLFPALSDGTVHISSRCNQPIRKQIEKFIT